MVEQLSYQEDLIGIEVAYAKPEEQVLISLQVPQGTTAMEALRQSGLMQRFPEINLIGQKIGIFGVVCKPEQLVKQGDRVEIYRPLLNDPKEARRLRAQKQ